MVCLYNKMHEIYIYIKIKIKVYLFIVELLCFLRDADFILSVLKTNCLQWVEGDRVCVCVCV